jgi:hypothetical protein
LGIATRFSDFGSGDDPISIDRYPNSQAIFTAIAVLQIFQFGKLTILDTLQPCIAGSCAGVRCCCHLAEIATSRPSIAIGSCGIARSCTIARGGGTSGRRNGSIALDGLQTTASRITTWFGLKIVIATCKRFGDRFRWIFR